MDPTFAFSAWAEGTVLWSGLAQRLQLPAADAFPLPLPSPWQPVRLRASIGVNLAPAAGTPKFLLRFEVDYPVREFTLWGLTVGRTVRLVFDVELMDVTQLQNAQTRFDNPAPGTALQGKLSVEGYFKLPQLPALDFLRIHSGDAEGWQRLRLTVAAGTEWGGANASMQLHAEVTDPFEAELFIPDHGVPLARLTVSALQGDLEVAANKVTGTIASDSKLLFKPQFGSLGIPAAEYLGQLLDGIAPDEISAHISLTLAIENPNPSATITCTLTGAGVAVDVFQMLRDVTRGGAAAEPIPAGQAGPIDAGTLGFDLTGFWMKLNRTPELAMTMRARIGPLDPLPEAYLKLSTTEVEVGLGRATPDGQAPALRFPLTLPRISREQMGFSGPAATAHRNPGTRPAPDQIIWNALSSDGRDRYDDLLEMFLSAVELSTGASPAGFGPITGYKEKDQFDEWVWRVKVRDPAPPGFTDPVAMRVAAGTVLRDRGDGILEDTGELLFACEIDGQWHVLAASVALVLDQFAFHMSLRNPRDIRVSGTASFAVDGPFAPISNLKLTVGISADLIFFSVDVAGATVIEIPELIRGYGGGKLILGRLAFGFGYTKRSLAVAFDGGLVLPEQFVDDLDTSDQAPVAGVRLPGIRLPVQSRLVFQLDVIPVTMGNWVIPFPMFQFSLDMRRDVSPGLRDPRTCEPNWDGLQVIVPDVVHVSLKKISYSPFFIMACMSNSEFDGDLVLGDSHNGLSIVADNIFWAFGVVDSGFAMSVAPIVGLPFFDNACISLRIAGFALHFHMQRPIPSFSPFAIFEIMALVADPVHYNISPRGELADMVRVSVLDSYVSLPEPARMLFPEGDALLRKPLNISINLATFITILQRGAQALESLATVTTTAIQNAASDAQAAERVASDLLEQARSLRPSDIGTVIGQILSGLPPEMRKMRWSADFAGFEANAVLVLMNWQEAIDGIGHRNDPGDDIEPSKDVTQEMTFNADLMRTFVPQLPAGAARMVDVADPREHPLRGSEFDGFTDGDLGSLPEVAGRTPDKTPGVLLTANVKFLAGQRARFIGMLYEDGTFAMATSVGVEPLRLALPGIEKPIELNITARTRLQLMGRVRRHGGYASVRGEGWIKWDPIPGLVHVNVPMIAMSVRGDGVVSGAGKGEVLLFGERGRVAGSVEFDRNYCTFTGSLAWSDPRGIEIGAQVRGQIGPEERYELEGDGHLTVLGMEFPGFHFRAAGRRIEVSGKLRLAKPKQGEVGGVANWSFDNGQAFPCTLDINAQGVIDLTDALQPDISLSGSASLVLDGLGLSITGRGGIAIKDGVPITFVEGVANWLGRDWVSARAELGANGLRLHAQATVAFDPPNPMDANGNAVVLPEFQLQANLAMDFAIQAPARVTVAFKGQVVAGLKLVDQQVLPIAMAKVDLAFDQMLMPFRGAPAQVQEWTAPLLEVRAPIPDLRAGLDLSGMTLPTITIHSGPDHNHSGDGDITLTYVTGINFRHWRFDRHTEVVHTMFHSDVSWPTDARLPIPRLTETKFNVSLVLRWDPNANPPFSLHPRVVTLP